MRTIGIDCGISGTGGAYLDYDSHEILEMFSSICDVPQEGKSKKSLAKIRREARSSRRNNKRTIDRQEHCLRLLKLYGIVPEDASRQWFQSRKGDKPVTKLRVKGLDHKLTNRELAQVLYKLCSQRGYIPHGEGDIDADDDQKQVLSAIKTNRQIRQEKGYRTVGEMLAHEGKSRNSSGDYSLCVLNKDLLDEASAIIKHQRAFGSNLSREKNGKIFKLEDEFEKVMTWQKTDDSRDARIYATVGNCVYFPSEKRAAKADLSSEMCNAYESFLNITIVDENGDEYQLSHENVQRYFDILFSPVPLNGNSNCKVTYKRIREDLDLPTRSVFKGIDRDNDDNDKGAKTEKAEIYIPKTWRFLRKELSKESDSGLIIRIRNDRHLADAICEALTYSSSEDSLASQLAPLDLSEDEKKTIIAFPFNGKIFKGYASRSLKALDMLLGAFEDSAIRTLADAEKSVGLRHDRHDRRIKTADGLLPPYSEYDPTCNNPVVLRAMSRMRRAINAMIKKRGLPDRIYVEVARELKQTKHERELISKRNNVNKAGNKNAADFIAKFLGIEPEEVPGKLIRKYRLWELQDGKDIYDISQSIDLERMIKDDTYCEIDHILPYSRTADNSPSNKVLTLKANNQNKAERTPYEWMTQDKNAPSWEAFNASIRDKIKSAKMRSKLLCTDLAGREDEFLNRNLNDTRYMSVAVMKYLEDCLPFPADGNKHVFAVAGGATGMLRHAWGLNMGKHGEKDREDNRHHAIDACVIAACSPTMVRKVAIAHSHGIHHFEDFKHSQEVAVAQPWPTFVDDVRARYERTIPTHAIDQSATGRVFEDFSYRFEGNKDKSRIIISRAGAKPKTAGNFYVSKTGEIKLYDGIAFLRLWHDPEARKGKGRYYADPVYYADITAIKNGSYIPKIAKAHYARTAWEPIPENALSANPIVIFRNDVLLIDGFIGRYMGFHIGRANFDSVISVRSGMELKNFPSVNKLTNDSKITILHEDCLGHCYDDLLDIIANTEKRCVVESESKRKS